MGEKSVPNVPNKKGGGNTRTPTFSPAKKWVFTLNNHKEDEIKNILEVCSNDIYAFQEEVGEKKGTPHLQGLVVFQKKCRPKNKFQSKRIHWKKMRGTPLEALNYCMKEFTRKPNGRCWYKNIPEKWDKKDNKPPAPPTIPYGELWDYQRKIVNMICEEPDNRSIFWFWRYLGGAGKTELQKYLFENHGAIIVSGRRSDMKNMVMNYILHQKIHPKIIIINVPRQQTKISCSFIRTLGGLLLNIKK